MLLFQVSVKCIKSTALCCKILRRDILSSQEDKKVEENKAKKGLLMSWFQKVKI